MGYRGPMSNHTTTPLGATYLAGWAGGLASNPDALFRAVLAADKAVTIVLNTNQGAN